MKLADLEKSVGGLSKESKMPWLCWGIPASLCKTGSKLAKVKGTVCEMCYAMKGMYNFSNVQTALSRRYNAWKDSATFVSNFSNLLNRKAYRVRKEKRYFRWFPSGDLQEVQMLKDIADICAATPAVHHYLPTKEYEIVREYLDLHERLPDNLVVRLSAPKVDQIAELVWNAPNKGVNYSAVVTDGTSNCPADEQGNKCGDCRKCWDPNVLLIKYKLS